MIKFFHTADIHIGVENYGKIETKTGIHSRLSDFQKSFEECIDRAIKEQIDFFLFCGDAYKTAFPTPTQQKVFMGLLFKLQENGIPVVNVVGNHDHPLTFGKTNSLDILNDLPLDGFYVFSKPSILKLQTKNGPIQIVGIPWPTRNNIITDQNFHLKSSSEITSYISQALGEIIKDFANKLNPKIPSILAGHLTVSNGVFSGSEKCAVFGNDPVLLPSQLALKEFDYVALGHLHRHQNLNSKGYPAVVYSGSLERIDFGEKKDTKGFCRVTIDSSARILRQAQGERSKEFNPVKTKLKHTAHPELVRGCSFEFVPVKTRPMIQIEVKLITGKDQTEQIINAIEKQNIKDAIVKIIYHVPEGKKDKVELQQIQQACIQAIHLVSIIPIRKPIIREKRTTLKVDMDINTLLCKYFESKEYPKEKSDNLLNKAQELYSKIIQKGD